MLSGHASFFHTLISLYLRDLVSGNKYSHKKSRCPNILTIQHSPRFISEHANVICHEKYYRDSDTKIYRLASVRARMAFLLDFA